MTQQNRKTAHPRLNGTTSFLSLAAAAMFGGVVATTLVTTVTAKSGFDADSFRQLNLFGEVFDQVHEHYVSDPDDKVLIEGAIQGMLSNLDPHSSYMAADDFDRMQEQTRGSFAGLGIQVSMETQGMGKGLVKVISPIDDTPAAKVGVEPGDLIYEIDGESVFGMTLDEAISLMKGAKGTPVDVKIIRDGVNEPVEYTIVRDIVTVNPVVSRMERDDIGYVRLTGFTAQTETKMRDAIRQLNGEAPNGLKGLVLDLRNNPGGLLDQAVGVSSAFLDGGEIVSTRGRRVKDSLRELGEPGEMLPDVPIIVLVNGGSASASEIVAGALQDRNRALLLGTKTFGKGSVQTVLPLESGVNGAIRLTTARYYTPSGRSIQAQGIIPDIVMPLTRADGSNIEEGRRREADLKGALDVPEDEVETTTDAADVSAEASAADTSTSTSQQILMEGQRRLNKEKQEEENKTALFVEPVECPAETDCHLNRALDLLEDKNTYSQLLADAREIERL